MAENRGGPRSGQPGKLYPRRTDMAQPTRLPVGQEHGVRKQLEQAQSKQPLPQGGSTPAARVPADDTRGQIPSLSDPTARPNEPLTAGLPIGPGPGPEALMGLPQVNQELQVLRAIFMQYPNEDIRRLIEFNENNL